MIAVMSSAVGRSSVEAASAATHRETCSYIGVVYTYTMAHSDLSLEAHLVSSSGCISLSVS